jgi:hypothetical protein
VGSTGKATVKRFNGSSWVVVGNQRFTTGNAWDIHLASVGNTPYISFREFISSTDNKVSVMALNGTTWSYVGSRGISINVAPNTSGRNELCYDTLQHKLYLVTAQKSGFPDGVGIFEWVESSWVNIGNITTSMLADNFYSVDYGKLAIHQGRPVVIVESGLGDITAFKYNGTTWQPFLNNTPINDSGTFDFDVCSYNDTLYVSYGDQRYTETPDGRTTVQRFFTGNSILHSNGLTLSGRRQPQTQLQWSTLSEQGTVNFIVEASTDNRQFVAIATVNASGYTNRTTTYQHTPNLSIMDKATFFRIRQVNMNGTTQYSNTIYLPLSTANLTVNVFPNPFIDKIQLQLHVSDASTVQLVLTNTYGQAIQQHVQQVTKGYNTLTVKAPSHLPQGTYFLEVRYANERYTFQLAH